jgi:hypothetical protein
MNQYIKYILFFSFNFLYTKEHTQTLSPEDITKIAEKCFDLYLNYKKAILNASSESIKKALELNLIQKNVFRDFLPLAATSIIPIIYLCITSNVNPFKSISKITLKKNTLAIDTTLKDKSLPENIRDIAFDKDKKFFLFYGPPGSGKTYGAEILAAHNNAHLHKTTNNIFNVEVFIGTDIGKIKPFFENLQKLATENPHTKIFVLIDEVDSMGKRGQQNPFNSDKPESRVNYMLEQLDLIKNKYENIWIIFTTNYRENLDDAFLSRINTHIKFELPTKELINSIFNKANENEEENNKTVEDFIKNLNEVEKKNGTDFSVETMHENENTFLPFGEIDYFINEFEALEKKRNKLNQETNKFQFDFFSECKKHLESYKIALSKQDFISFLTAITRHHQCDLRDIHGIATEIKNKKNIAQTFFQKISTKKYFKKNIEDIKIIEKLKTYITYDENQFKQKLDLLKRAFPIEQMAK